MVVTGNHSLDLACLWPVGCLECRRSISRWKFLSQQLILVVKYSYDFPKVFEHLQPKDTIKLILPNPEAAFFLSTSQLCVSTRDLYQEYLSVQKSYQLANLESDGGIRYPCTYLLLREFYVVLTFYGSFLAKLGFWEPNVDTQNLVSHLGRRQMIVKSNQEILWRSLSSFVCFLDNPSPQKLTIFVVCATWYHFSFSSFETKSN